jgi:hypothetical protein
MFSESHLDCVNLEIEGPELWSDIADYDANSDPKLLFYLHHVFDAIDTEKWCNNRPTQYWVKNNGDIVAVLTVTKRTLEGSEEPIDHIWLCGVHDDQRGKGLFSKLIQRFSENCTDIISVATYPEKWKNMYAWIVKKGGNLIHKYQDGKCVFTILKKDL